MGLVDDQGVIATQHWVRLNFCQQNTVGHEFDQSGGTDLIGESHLVADDLARLFAHLLAKLSGNAFCNRTRCDTARLGVPDHAAHAST